MRPSSNPYRARLVIVGVVIAVLGLIVLADIVKSASKVILLFVVILCVGVFARGSSDDKSSSPRQVTSTRSDSGSSVGRALSKWWKS